MEGPEDPLPAAAMIEEGAMAVDRRGMISRAVEQVFSSAIELKETGWEVRESNNCCLKSSAFKKLTVTVS
ncbi:MAG: hypothetical protein MJE68_01510 [Proteobacteria bacterium]|nr:hypothetical protein [Pseudomonadota bacterium]